MTSPFLHMILYFAHKSSQRWRDSRVALETLSGDKVFACVYKIVAVQHSCTPFYYNLIMLLIITFIPEIMFLSQSDCTNTYCTNFWWRYSACSPESAPAAGRNLYSITKIQTNCIIFLAHWNQIKFLKSSGIHVWHTKCWRCRVKRDVLPPTQFTSLTSHPRVMMMSSFPPPDKLLSRLAWTRGGVNHRNCILLCGKFSWKFTEAYLSWRQRYMYYIWICIHVKWKHF